MPIRQLADAGAQSTVSAPITNSQTSVTLASASGFPAVLQGGQISVIILDTGAPGYSAASPLATNYEYQQVNAISGNVLTFGPGGGSAARSSYAGTTPKAFFAGATVAQVLLAEDLHASTPWKFDEQSPTTGSVRIPASGSFPTSYLGVNFRHIVVEWAAKGTDAGNQDLRVQMNGDTGANYNWAFCYNTGAAFATPLSGGQVNVVSARVGDVGKTSPAADISSGRLEILAFANTANYRVAVFQSLLVQSTLFQQVAGGASWNNAASAITSLLLFPSAGSFAGPSLFTTYLIP